ERRQERVVTTTPAGRYPIMPQITKEQEGLMDICMLTPSELTDLQELLGEFETVKGKLLAYLEKIEEGWQQEIQKAPDPNGPKTERSDLPKSRLQILTEWIGHLDEQTVQLADMEEIVPKDPKLPIMK